MEERMGLEEIKVSKDRLLPFNTIRKRSDELLSIAAERERTRNAANNGENAEMGGGIVRCDTEWSGH